MVLLSAWNFDRCLGSIVDGDKSLGLRKSVSDEGLDEVEQKKRGRSGEGLG